MDLGMVAVNVRLGLAVRVRNCIPVHDLDSTFGIVSIWLTPQLVCQMEQKADSLRDGAPGDGLYGCVDDHHLHHAQTCQPYRVMQDLTMIVCKGALETAASPPVESVKRLVVEEEEAALVSALNGVLKWIEVVP